MRLTVKNSENVVKNVDVSKNFCNGGRQFFRNEGGTEGLLVKNIGILLTYREVIIYLKYCTSQPLQKIVKMR